MLKIGKNLVCALVTAFVAVVSSPVFAEPVTITGTGALIGTTSLGVKVYETIELTYWIQEVPSGKEPYDTGTSDVTQSASGMDFGEVKWTGKADDGTKMNIFTANKFFTIFLIGKSNVPGFKIVQNFSGLANGSADINMSLVMTPGYEPTDKWGGVTGSIQGPQVWGTIKEQPVVAYGGTRTIFDSYGNGVEATESGIVRCYYGITTGNTDPAKGTVYPTTAKVLDSDTVAGTYQGTVTISIVAK